MCAKAPGFAPGIEENRLLQAGLEAWHRPIVGGGGNLTPGHFPVGHASHSEAALGRHDIFDGRFEQMRRDLPGLVDDALCRQCQSPTAHDGTTAAEGADPLLDCQRVAVSYSHVIHRDAQLVGHHLREAGPMSLAVRPGTGEHRDCSSALYAHRGAFKPDPAARFYKRRDTYADQFATRPRRIAVLDHLVVVREPQCFRERLLVIARIVFHIQARAVWELLRPDKIFATDVKPVQAEVARRFIDQTLDVEHRLRPASAAIRTGGDGVGKDRHYLDAAVADLIATRGHAHHAQGRNRRDGLQGGAHVRDYTHLEPQHGAVPFER